MQVLADYVVISTSNQTIFYPVCIVVQIHQTIFKVSLLDAMHIARLAKILHFILNTSICSLSGDRRINLYLYTLFHSISYVCTKKVGDPATELNICEPNQLKKFNFQEREHEHREREENYRKRKGINYVRSRTLFNECIDFQLQSK